MKNVLIISYFHSSQCEVGAIRTQRFVDYLPEFGWRSYVLTKAPSGKKDDQALNDLRDICFVPSIPLNRPLHLESFLWVPVMIKRAVEILKEIHIDVVLISCPPFYQAIGGILLKKWFGTKLVVDYRDAWGLNPYRQRLSSFRRFALQGDTVLEHQLLRNTNLLIVSHQAMKDRYVRRFSFLGDRVRVIYNGFDPESTGSPQPPLFREFTILHLGNFYGKQKMRDPDLFLSALQQAVSEREIPPETVRVLFVGEKYPQVEEAIRKRGLSAYVSYQDRVPHNAAMEYLKKSHAFLLIETEDVMTTKVYEYLATGKPMLCIVRKGGELESFIQSFSTNAYILPDNVEQIKNGICNCFEEYRSGRYVITNNFEFRNEFNRRAQTRHLAELLDQLGI